MEKTVKLHAYTGEAKSEATQANLAEEEKKSLELARKNALLEEEKIKSLEHLKTIVQLRESLRQEQAKSAELARKMAEMEAKVKALAGLEAGELAMKNAQLEDEKKRSLEHLKTIELHKESLRQEQAKTAELEAKVKDMNELLNKISSFAAMAKPG